jgi:hypothetical protein
MLIKAHYCSEKLLELVKTLKASSPFAGTKICPLIQFTSALDMQFSLFKITMQFNIVTAMEAPFHVNPLTWLWRTLEASRILQLFP